MNLPYWEYFLALESDLEKSTQYVDFSIRNFNTYSVEFAIIIMSAASEFDTVAKEICKIVAPAAPCSNIDHYCLTISSRYKNFCSLEIEVPRYGLLLSPWQGWRQKNSPSWWKGYNAIKHDRTASFHLANLENALLSVSGLLVAILYFYDCKYGIGKPPIDAFFAPRLFSPKDPYPSELYGGGIYWSYTLA